MDFLLSNLHGLTTVGHLNCQNTSPLTWFWVSFAFVLLLVAYKCLCKLSKIYLLHSAVPTINKDRFTRGLWRFLFSLWLIVGVVMKSYFQLQGSFFQAATATHCTSTFSNLATEEDISSDCLIFVATVAFFMHEIFISMNSHEETPFLSLCGLIFLTVAACSINCPSRTFQILVFLALNVGTMELARVFYASKSRHRGYVGPSASNFIKFFSPFTFLLHFVSWLVVNFYLYPLFFFSLPSVTEVVKEHRLATMYINIFLIGFAKQQFFCSPGWTLFKLLFRRPSGRQRSKNILSLLGVVLLPYSGMLITELRNIQLLYLSEAPPSSAERRMLRKKFLSSGNKVTAIDEPKKFSSNQAAELMSMVQCVKILKRKMRHRYEQKVAKEESSQDKCEMENLLDVTEDNLEADDVTDIFIPVPSVSLPTTNHEQAEDVIQDGLDDAGKILLPDEHSQTCVSEDSTSLDFKQSLEDDTAEKSDLLGDED